MKQWILCAAVLATACAGQTDAPANSPAQTQPAAGSPAPAAGAANASAQRAVPVNAPAPAAAPAQPATAKYPSAELAALCGKKADDIRRQYGRKLKVVVHPPFVIAGDMSEAKLDSHAKWSVVRPARAMWTAYFDKKPDKVITTLLFAGADNYKLHARKDYPSGGAPYYGYYTPARRTMVMNINTGGGTLVHELTHALIVYDFPNPPTWFNEGLASLHEQCQVAEAGITGLPNWRLPALQGAIKAKTLRPLAELVTRRDFYGPLQGINYAQARYFVMYMQHKGLLVKFYRYFREHAKGDDADVRAVEHIFGRKISDIEPAFLAWVMTLKFER